jgi:hypothetical protein
LAASAPPALTPAELNTLLKNPQGLATFGRVLQRSPELKAALMALPEGEVEAATALVKFARLDGQNRLIGGKVLAFDMRSPPRLYMRMPENVAEPGAAAAGQAEAL